MILEAEQIEPSIAIVERWAGAYKYGSIKDNAGRAQLGSTDSRGYIPCFFSTLQQESTG